MHALTRFKTLFALVALCLLMGGTMTQVAAQDAATADSPIVGVWLAPPTPDETGSILILTSDGALVDHETDGTLGTGVWNATGPTSGVLTFVFFMTSDEFTGNIIIRATLDYDEATDTLNANYNITGTTPDGTVVWAQQELTPKTLTRMPAQGPDVGNLPLDGLSAPAEAATRPA